MPMPRSLNGSRTAFRGTRAGGSSTAKSCTSADERARLLDTNVLVYADDASSPEKRERALRFLRSVCAAERPLCRDAQTRGGAGDGATEGRDPGSQQSRSL